MKLLVLSFLFGTVAFGVDVPVDTTPISDDQALSLFFQLIGGLKGAAGLVVALIVVQVIFVVMKSRLGEKTGIYRMIVLSALALILGVLGQLANGQSLTAALLNSSTLAAFQALLAQGVIQWQNRGEDKALTVLPPK